MKYFQLRCKTCDTTFLPVVATTENELLFPDYEETETQVGRLNTDRFESFHAQHYGHALETFEVMNGADESQSVLEPPSKSKC